MNDEIAYPVVEFDDLFDPYSANSLVELDGALEGDTSESSGIFDSLGRQIFAHYEGRSLVLEIGPASAPALWHCVEEFFRRRGRNNAAGGLAKNAPPSVVVAAIAREF